LEATFGGLKDSIETTGGITVKPPPTAVAPCTPCNRAVMVTGVLLATGFVPTLIGLLGLVLLAPGLIVKPAGSVAALHPPVQLSVPINPPPPGAEAGGAGPFRVTVPTVVAPPVTELGLNVIDVITGGMTIKFPVAVLVLRVAVTVTVVEEVTPTVVRVKV